MSKVLEGLLYSETHEWVKVEGNIATVGVSDYAQESLGSVVYVEGFIDSDVAQGEECGAIEYARKLALDSVNQAKEILDILPDSSSKQVLLDIADFVLERNT